jgi:hypothetical protein
MMDELKTGRAEWLSQVEATVDKYAGANAGVQEAICNRLEGGLGEEAAAKARELFAAQSRLAPNPLAADRRRLNEYLAKQAAKPKEENEGQAALKRIFGLVAEPKPKPEPKPEPAREKVQFHQSDKVEEEPLPPTVEEKQEMLEELADLWTQDPLAFDTKLKDAAGRLGVTKEAAKRAVRKVRDERPKEEREESQASKIVAIGFEPNVQLWHAPNGMGYASIKVDGHRENYRIDSTAFERWLRAEFGSKNQVKIGGRWAPQVTQSGALRDAIHTLESYAMHQPLEFQPALRVGGNREVIYLDLGRPDWSVVRITAEGWRLVYRADDVAFIRTANMLPLPEPVRGGNIQALKSVLNVHPSEFVLAVAWLLQALNPIGPYPLVDIYGEAEQGKTTICKMMGRFADPNSTGLRKAKRVDDLLIAAKNNWVIGFDNLSSLSGEWSDTLCMLSTGIATGARALYTDDEEHAFQVQRPALFNGIPGDLTERSDLASRIIKLEVPHIGKRRTEEDLGKEFEAIWPQALGALLDGLAGALAGQAEIEVEDPARLMDFEKFAEAGCRAMGFDEWEFVDAYAANRKGSMIVAAEASTVGQAIMRYLKANPKGFRGQMAGLHAKLNAYKGDARWNQWPGSPTKLSSELSRISKPLANIGIICRTKVDRRAEGGTQKDVVLKYAEGV